MALMNAIDAAINIATYWTQKLSGVYHQIEKRSVFFAVRVVVWGLLSARGSLVK